jgi:hypothetical protein
MGVGSLKVLHLPTWLRPFDLLRPLPGFRSFPRGLGVLARVNGAPAAIACQRGSGPE